MMVPGARESTGLAAVLVLMTLAAIAASGDEARWLELQQAADIDIATAPDGARIISLAGRLWQLPADGAAATAITPPGVHARHPAFSPDGGTLAYEALQDGHFQVMIAAADGSNPRQLSSGPWHHLAPAWSASGRQLAISSNRGGDYGIWLLQVDSGELRQLSFDRGDEFDPAWAPEGEDLAYISEEAGRSRLVLHAPGHARQVLVEGGTPLYSPAWRPDGSLISFVSAEPPGGRLKMVILSTPPVVKPLVRGERAALGRMAWPDRNHFLYAADGRLHERRFGVLDGAQWLPLHARVGIRAVDAPPSRRLSPIDEEHHAHAIAGFTTLPDGHLVVAALGDLWELDADGRPLRALTRDAFVDRDPVASRDGRWLAYTSDRSGSPQIWLMDLAGGGSRQLGSAAGAASRPALSPDGRYVACLVDAPDGSGQQLKLIALADGSSRELASGLAAAGTPSWSPDGARIAVVQDEGGSRRLLLYPSDAGGGLRRILLSTAAAAAGRNETAWSADGRWLAIASAAGIRVLPVLEDGLVGADWQARHEAPVQWLHWQHDSGALLFADGQGLAQLTGDGSVRRIPVSLDWRPLRNQGRIVIRAGRLFTGLDEGYLYDQKVVIEGERITGIGPWSDAGLEGSRFIDARQQTVMPGLIDLGLQLPEAAGERLGRQLLAFGITTAQAFGPSATGIREVIERWQLHAAGPRLLQGLQWCPDRDQAPHERTVTAGALQLCPEAALQAAPRPTPPPAQPLWSAHWLAAASGDIIAIGPVAPGLARSADGAFRALLPPYQDALDTMIHAGTILIPDMATLGLPVLVEEQPGLLAAPQYQALVGAPERAAASAGWQAIMRSQGTSRRAWLREVQGWLGRYLAGGGRLAAASGAPAVPYGLGLHAQLRLMQVAGLPAGRLLRAATGEAAYALGLQDEIGSIATGHRADLLFIDGDPLADPQQLLQIGMVMIDGLGHPLPTLLPTARAPGPLEKFTSPRAPKTPGTAGRDHPATGLR